MTESMRGETAQDTPVHGGRVSSAKSKPGTTSASQTKAKASRAKATASRTKPSSESSSKSARSKASKAKQAPSKKVAGKAKSDSTSIAADVPTDSPPKTSISSQEAGNIFGQVTWLMANSPLHKHMFLSDLEWLVMPPVRLNQFRIFRKNGQPVAFASWAYLSNETEQEMMNGRHRLKPHEWKEGEQPWLIDLVAPFGGGEDILAHLRDQVFSETGLKTIVPSSTPGETEVVSLQAAQGQSE